MSLPDSSPSLATARARIADCLQLSDQGRPVQRREHLNLANLKLTDAEFATLTAPFDPQERGLPAISLASLPHLRYLDLTGNQLTELPECVPGFPELVWLGLNFNGLTHLDGLGRLTRLARLYLRGNALTRLPDGMANLRQLVALDLTQNRFANPDRALLRLLEGKEDAGFHLGLADNPGEFTLRATDGVTAFREHVRGLLHQGVDVREGKLLLVGEGRMGKSTLLQALLGRPYLADRKQTHGLKMKPLVLPTARGDVRLNCWDFSGQKELRETHQIFFTEPAIYLVVWNAGQTVDAEDLRQWLWLIKHRTNGRGRALVVATNTDMNARPLTGEQQLRDEFGGPESILLEPKFLKDRGAMFGRQFRLHLFCERLLKPVSYLRGTETCGCFDFEMTEEWLTKAAPYLKATGRLLATLLPAAGLVGSDWTALARPAKDLKELADQAEKMLTLAGPVTGAAATTKLADEHEVWMKMPGRAAGRDLTWLHDFLKQQCATDDLTTAHELGLQRTLDKTSNRYLWVHHTQT